MKKDFFLLILFALFVGCASHHYSEHYDAKHVRSGMLKPGIDKQAFLDVWGEPDRTRAVTLTSENNRLTAKWNRYGGTLSEGQQYKSYLEWSYEKLGVDLLFYGNDLPTGERTKPSQN